VVVLAGLYIHKFCMNIAKNGVQKQILTIFQLFTILTMKMLLSKKYQLCWFLHIVKLNCI